MTSKKFPTRPPEGTLEELIWLRGFEAGVQTMREDMKAQSEGEKTAEAERRRVFYEETLAIPKLT